MLKLRLSNLICLTTYLRILFLFDNSHLLTLSKHKSYQRLYSVNITWKLFLKFLKSLSTHTTKFGKGRFCCHLFMYAPRKQRTHVDSHLASVACKLPVARRCLLLTLFTHCCATHHYDNTRTHFPLTCGERTLRHPAISRIVCWRRTMSSSIYADVFKLHHRSAIIFGAPTLISFFKYACSLAYLDKYYWAFIAHTFIYQS